MEKSKVILGLKQVREFSTEERQKIVEDYLNQKRDLEKVYQSRSRTWTATEMDTLIRI